MRNYPQIVNSSVRVKHYDTNGHNFGIEEGTPDRVNVEKVLVQLPGWNKPKVLKAIAAYKKTKRATIRSTYIDKWLRQNSLVGQEFSAKFSISDDGKEHLYHDFCPIWL